MHVSGCERTHARTHVLKCVSGAAVLPKGGKRMGLGRGLICYFSPQGGVQLKVST